MSGAIADAGSLSSAALRESGDVGLTAVFRLRLWFAVLSILGLSAFIFGVGNRFTSDGLFLMPPHVDWIPPLSAQYWQQAFVIHGQDPTFSACGGTISLADFKTLYWWEWLRRASGLLLALAAVSGIACACLVRSYRFALGRIGAFGLIIISYALAIAAVDLMVQAETISRYNVGQYRHAVHIIFASVGVAALLVSIVRPPLPPALSRRARRVGLGAAAWIGALLLDTGFGAFFASLNATAFWPTWPGYESGVIPPLDHLLALSPLWLNFTANAYMVQLCHRALSIGLWVAALAWLLWSLGRARGWPKPGALLLVLSAQMAVGIATLTSGAPAALSILHQVGGIFVLFGSFVILTLSAAQHRGAIATDQFSRTDRLAAPVAAA